MALIMTLSAFSGLFTIPTFAASSDIDDAVWVGDGYYVTKDDNNNYHVGVSDDSKFVAVESGIESVDGRYVLAIVNHKSGDKNYKALSIKNTVTETESLILDYDTGEMKASKKGALTELTTDFTLMVFPNQEDKLLTMQKMLESSTHVLFAQPYSGEVACLDKRSGQVLFTNPYDVYTCDNKSQQVRDKLVSQIILGYTDISGNSKEMYSYSQIAKGEGSIKVKLIKGGIRVEYTLGRDASNYLVPRQISQERFDTLIMDKLIENGASQFVINRFKAFYSLKDYQNETLEQLKKEMLRDYPITEQFPIYVLSTDIKTREIAELENFIKQYCPDYSYEDLDYDHTETLYESLEKSPANFKMSIEYSLNSDGMTARLPANGIRYDATNYTLKTIKVLPYVGAGSNENTGYIFLPDGSGSITRFEDYVGKSINVSGKLYGVDYAYHTVEGRLQETMRLPVFGVVDNDSYTYQYKVPVEVPEVEDTTVADPETEGDANAPADNADANAPADNADANTPADNADANAPTADGETTPPATEGDTEAPVVEEQYEIKEEVKAESKGFLAIIEEGDAMVSIMSTSGGGTHKYYSVEVSFSPRQRDEYRLSDSISAASNSAIIVESKRKYVGSLTMRYVMLTDTEIAEEKGIENSYEPTWMGMAKAYRDYLTANGTLTKLTEVGEDLPLYIETFGTLETTEKIASIPVTVDKALTSFEQIKSMYDELSSNGVSNINFKLQGYYNGGMYSTVPYKLDWQDAAGGEEGFIDLVEYANGKFGVYPDFDFEYQQMSGAFDGFSEKEHSVKTIDNRYSSRVMYNAATQDYTTWGGMCISPSAFSYLFEGLDERYSEYNNSSISVSTLGYALNSDFDEDDPYNREDSKAMTANVLKQISDKYRNVMAEGGNSYTLGYIDHLLDVSLDSSRYALTSAAVPFMGVVIHGSINFAGSPINMEGDMDYALLKAIENGASLYFILSTDNTELLKEDVTLSQYYSVRYEYWKDDVVETYNKINNAIADLQDQYIVDHEFVDASRVPDTDEAEADKIAAEKAETETNNKYTSAVSLEVARRLQTLYARAEIENGMTVAAFENAREIDAAVRAAKGDNAFLLEYVAAVDEAGNKVFTYNDGIVLTVKSDKTVEISITEEGLEKANAQIEKDLEDAKNVVVFDKYATTYGTVAKVTYENGTYFVLNYNDYSIVTEVDGISYTIPSYSFITVKEGKIYNFNSADKVIWVGTTQVAAGESIAIN